MSAATALAALAIGATPASATRVSVPVVNEAAPWVRIVSPAHGARLVAGAQVVVRVESGDADRTSMVVDGAPVWSGRGAVLQGSWGPDPGPHRLVAVAERAGAPDAVAFVDVVAVEPAAAPADSAPPAGGGALAPGAPGLAPPDPAGSAPGGARPGADPRPGGPRTSAPEPAVAVPGPGTADPTAGAGPTAGDHRAGGGPLAALGRLLRDPERVAWTVAFPLLLIVAAVAYALLQRFIDGGQKLAWRGRGRPDDSLVEF